MLCPTCKDVSLSMTDRQGIEIDYCPECRGIWLDRGELDRLIERSEQSSPTPAPTAVPFDKNYQQHSGDRNHTGHPHKRRKSMLGELFDF